MTAVISFDPGETTGCVVGYWLGGKDISITDVALIPWADRFAQTGELLKLYTPDYIVIEDFRLYHHRAQTQIGNTFPSVQMIGIILTYCFQLGYLDRITKQPASNMKSVKIADEHLLMVGASPHIQDAYKHLRYFVIVNLLRKGVQP